MAKPIRHPNMGNLPIVREYAAFLEEIKGRIRSARLKAAVSVNKELLGLYWDLGEKIAQKQKESDWGDSVVEMLSADLSGAFPGMSGFSRANLFNIRKWRLFYLHADEKVQQAVRQIPWGHNIAIINKSANLAEAEFYVAKTLENGWPRSVLVHQIESGLFSRNGKAITNFKASLPAGNSEFAQESIKDPYIFDFLDISERALERDLERQLTAQITSFLLELGSGFSYVGKQCPIEVGGEQYYLDLLFYHLKLRCYVVIELKTGDFKPEYAGKMNFYLSAVDSKLKSRDDAPSIGIILCKGRNRVVAEYALRNVAKPIGVSEYKLQKSIPKKLRPSLPSVEELEKGLSGKKVKK